MKNTADPDPTRLDSRSESCDSWSRSFSGLWSLIPYSSLRPWVESLSKDDGYGNENVGPKYNLALSQVFRDYFVLFTLYNTGELSCNWMGTNSFKVKIENGCFIGRFHTRGRTNRLDGQIFWHLFVEFEFQTAICWNVVCLKFVLSGECEHKSVHFWAQRELALISAVLKRKTLDKNDQNQGRWPAVFVKTMVCWGCSLSRAQKTWLWSLLFEVFLLKLPIKPCSVASPFPRGEKINHLTVWGEFMSYCRRLVRLDGQIVLENQLSRRTNIRRFVRREIRLSRLHIRRFVRLRRFVRPDDCWSSSVKTAIVTCSHSRRQNLKFGDFTLLFCVVRQRNARKFVWHVQHEYFPLLTNNILASWRCRSRRLCL